MKECEVIGWGKPLPELGTSDLPFVMLRLLPKYNGEPYGMELYAEYEERRTEPDGEIAQYIMPVGWGICVNNTPESIANGKQKLLDYACDELDRHVLSGISTLVNIEKLRG